MATFLLTFPPLNNYLGPMMNLFFTATRYNPQHLLHQLLPPSKTLVITSICVGMDLLYLTCSLVTCKKIFWTLCYTVMLISCFYRLLAWLGICTTFCIRMPYFVTCMSVDFEFGQSCSLKHLTYLLYLTNTKQHPTNLTLTLLTELTQLNSTSIYGSRCKTAGVKCGSADVWILNG